MVDLYLEDMIDYSEVYKKRVTELWPEYDSTVLMSFTDKINNPRWKNTSLSIELEIDQDPDLMYRYYPYKLTKILGKDVMAISHYGIKEASDYLSKLISEPETRIYELRVGLINSFSYVGIDNPEGLNISYETREHLENEMRKVITLGDVLYSKISELHEKYMIEIEPTMRAFFKRESAWHNNRNMI